MSHTLTMGPLEIHYEKIEGPGRTILFLHNSSGSLAVWDRQWQDNRLREYTLLRVDLPGHGDSARSASPEKDYSLSGMAQRILEMIEGLEISEYIVVAISLATNLIGEIADLLRGCKGIFLTGASVIGGELTPADILLPFEFGSVLFEEDPSNEALQNYFQGLVFHPEEQALKTLQRDYTRTDSRYRPTMGASIAGGAWTDEIRHLTALGKPLAWIYGHEEKIIRASYLDKIVLPRWRDRIHFIPGAGHLAPLDQPGAFNDLLLAFAGDTLEAR